MASPQETASGPATHEAELSTVDALAQLSFTVLGALERRAAEHQLSIIQTRLLGVLRDRQPTMNELARHLGLDKSSITGLVDRAERRGLVSRTPSTSDRRAVLVSLTEGGRSLASQVSNGFEADVTQLLASLAPADRRALTALVSRVLVPRSADRGIDRYPSGG